MCIILVNVFTFNNFKFIVRITFTLFYFGCGVQVLSYFTDMTDTGEDVCKTTKQSKADNASKPQPFVVLLCSCSCGISLLQLSLIFQRLINC